MDYKPRFTGGQQRTCRLQAWAGLLEVSGGPVDYKPSRFTGGQWRPCGLQAWQVYWRSVEDLWITSLAGLLEVSGGPVDYKPSRFIGGQ